MRPEPPPRARRASIYITNTGDGPNLPMPAIVLASQASPALNPRARAPLAEGDRSREDQK